MTDQGVALIVFFVSFALLIPAISWDADHRCPHAKCPHRKE